MIRIRDLRVDYDNFCAVRDLSLDIEAGQVCGLIGPNGAGKTTTMRTMLGLIEPTYGQVQVNGLEVRENLEQVNHLVGFMPDFPPVYEDLKVWEFLDLFAASYRIPKSRRPAIIDYHLGLVSLSEKRNAAISGLSRGMRQRMMLAKTLIPNPEVLLLDEPASGVDPQGRIDLKNIIKNLAAEGKTVLISSHILTEMNEFCTSVVIMDRGEVVVSGKLEEVNRSILGHALLTVEILDEPGPFLDVISRNPHAGLVDTAGAESGRYEFRYEGDSAASSELLANLIRAGVRVSSFTRRKDNLEELFLKVGTKGGS